MSFFRAFISRRTGALCHVIEQSVPFVAAGRIVTTDDEFEIIDLGFVADHEWADLTGRRASPARHVFARLKGLRLEQVMAAVSERADMPTFHDCPCTLEGIKQRLRERGPSGLPPLARAWLATVLPRAQVAAMGLGRGLPLSVLKAAEALRNRRDPRGGRRLPELEAQAQNQADAIARSRLRARRARAAEPLDPSANARPSK